MSTIPSVLRPWIAGDGLRPEVAPDWSYWFGLEEWSVWDASFLLLGWSPPPDDDPRYGVSFPGHPVEIRKAASVLADMAQQGFQDRGGHRHQVDEQHIEQIVRTYSRGRRSRAPRVDPTSRSSQASRDQATHGANRTTQIPAAPTKLIGATPSSWAEWALKQKIRLPPDMEGHLPPSMWKLFADVRRQTYQQARADDMARKQNATSGQPATVEGESPPLVPDDPTGVDVAELMLFRRGRWPNSEERLNATLAIFMRAECQREGGFCIENDPRVKGACLRGWLVIDRHRFARMRKYQGDLGLNWDDLALYRNKQEQEEDTFLGLTWGDRALGGEMLNDASHAVISFLDVSEGPNVDILARNEGGEALRSYLSRLVEFLSRYGFAVDGEAPKDSIAESRADPESAREKVTREKGPLSEKKDSRHYSSQIETAKMRSLVQEEAKRYRVVSEECTLTCFAKHIQKWLIETHGITRSLSVIKDIIRKTNPPLTFYQASKKGGRPPKLLNENCLKKLSEAAKKLP